MPQGRRVFSSLTVRENLTVAARTPKGGKAFWTVETVFDMFPRLKERHSQLASLLSGGEQQMLAIGRALMANPRVLLMDEPSEGLAPQIVAEVGRTIARLKGEGLSIVLVEQNIKLTLELADDIVILNSGRVVFTGAGQRDQDERRHRGAAPRRALMRGVRTIAPCDRCERWAGCTKGGNRGAVEQVRADGGAQARASRAARSGPRASPSTSIRTSACRARPSS